MSKFKNLFKKLFKSKKMTGLNFFILRAKLTFTKLRQAFVKTPILYNFDPKYHIRVETGALGYVIDGVLNQLTLDDLGQQHLVAFFSQKMIPAETRYETHNGELLAIVKTFKTQKHYLEEFLIDHNNFRWFMDIKYLSSRQVR